jgi:hypothetical protein
MNSNVDPLTLGRFVAQLDHRFPDTPVFLMLAGGKDREQGSGMFWLSEEQATALLRWLSVALAEPFDVAELDSTSTAGEKS